MPAKTILFLDQYSGLSGGQKVMTDVVGAFNAKGFRCVVVLPGKGPLADRLSGKAKIIYFPIGYYSITKKNLFDMANYIVRLPLLVLLCAVVILKERAALVYANGARTFAWASIACEITRKPVFWHVHSIFGAGLEKKVCVIFGKLACVKKIFAVSKAAAEPLKELEIKLKLAYNAVSAPPPAVDASMLRKEYGLSANAFLVADIAVIEEWKNQQDLIMAASLIRERSKKDISFFLIGDPIYTAPSRQAYKRKLRELAGSLGLSDTVFFTGFRGDMHNVLSSIDVLVISSKTPDPCPLVSLEAAAYGKPIVSTDLGGVKEMFKEDTEALFYKAGDYHALADRILLLYSDRRLASQIGEQARRNVSRYHDMEGFLEKITGFAERQIYGD